jgi:hypothetical protein
MNYLDLFPSSSREKPRFMALAAAVLAQAQDLIAVTEAINAAFSVGEAAGVQLDTLGEFFSIPRQYGWNDQTYREYIAKKLNIWRWNGTNEMVSEVLASQPGARMTDNGDGTVTVTAGGVYPVPAGIRAITV